MDFLDLYVQHCVRSYDKQMWLGDVLSDGDYPWQFDMVAGQLTFVGKFTLNIQLIGSESSVSNTWLWAWANEISAIPENLLEDALLMKAYGGEHQVGALSNAQLDLDNDHHGHNFAMVASGLCHADAYYRAPYEQGALFVTIHDDQIPKNPAHPINRVAMIFPQFIQNIPIPNHRLAFESYLRSYHLDVMQDGEMTIGRDSDGIEIRASFDDQFRLNKLETTLKG